jgi:hypothetical protein
VEKKLDVDSEKFTSTDRIGAERDARFSIKELFYEINKDLWTWN